MSTPMPTTGRERRPPKRRRWPRRLALAAAVLVVFALGVSLGKALDDGEPKPTTQTYVRTLQPLPAATG